MCPTHDATMSLNNQLFLIDAHTIRMKRGLRKILQHKRHVKARHWNPSKIPVEMCQFAGIPMAHFNVSLTLQNVSERHVPNGCHVLPSAAVLVSFHSSHETNFMCLAYVY